MIQKTELITKINHYYLRQKTKYSKLLKNIVFWFKSLFINNELELQELFSSFSDKLKFVEFYIKISTNAKKYKDIRDIAYKNFGVYENKFNKYKIEDSKSSFLKLKNKIQIDSLISHSLIIPIHNDISINNKSKKTMYLCGFKKIRDNLLIRGWKIIKMW